MAEKTKESLGEGATAKLTKKSLAERKTLDKATKGSWTERMTLDTTKELSLVQSTTVTDPETAAVLSTPSPSGSAIDTVATATLQLVSSIQKTSWVKNDMSPDSN